MRRAAQAAGRAGIVIGLGGAIAGMVATPALAAASLSVSPSGTITDNTTVTATGNDGGNATAINQSRTLTLTLSDPNGGALQQWSSGSVASTKAASVKGSLDTAGAINGAYTFTLKVNSTTAQTATTPSRATTTVAPRTTPRGTTVWFEMDGPAGDGSPPALTTG